MISKNQFGFMKNKRTKDAITLMTKYRYEKLDKSTPIAGTYHNLAKSFDTVNHEILLDKLSNYGTRGTVNKLTTKNI